MRTSAGVEFLLGDHLGSTSLTVNSLGGNPRELRYYPWGGVRWASGTTPTDYRFTGQMEVASIGLYFYNARWYDSALGRFVQADTIIPNPGHPVAWDRYAYVANNPVKYVDPSGHGYCNSDNAAEDVDCSYTAQDILEEFYGVNFSDSTQWTSKRIIDVYRAVLAVGTRIRQVLEDLEIIFTTAGEAFLGVYGGITFEWCNDCVEGYGWAKDDHLITFDGMYADPTTNERLIIHELGHLFDRAVCAANDPSGSCSDIFGSGTARDGLSGRTMLCANSQHCLGRVGHDGPEEGEHWGFAGGWGEWQFGADDGVGELWADMFLGWVFNTWETESTRGTNRAIYMNDRMQTYLDLISP